MTESNRTELLTKNQNECIEIFKKLFTYDADNDNYSCELSMELIKFLNHLDEHVINHYYQYDYDPVKHYFDDDLVYDIKEAIKRALNGYQPPKGDQRIKPWSLNVRNMNTMEYIKLYLACLLFGGYRKDNQYFYDKYNELLKKEKVNELINSAETAANVTTT